MLQAAQAAELWQLCLKVEADAAGLKNEVFVQS